MIITLTTDIGWEYVAEMKGVIFSINPNATIVDVTHDILPQNIMQGAFILYSIAPHFRNAIHVGVVDPGVGTGRKCIAIECKNAWFIGPDNGLLYPAAKRIGIKKLYEIEVGNASPVFHGRDVFAPTAALLSIKKSPPIKEIKKIKRLDFPTPIKKRGKTIGKILFIDKFGNIITNLKDVAIKEKLKIKISGRIMELRYLPSYGYGKKGEIIALQSSSGFLEIAKRDGNAASFLKAREGSNIEIFL